MKYLNIAIKKASLYFRIYFFLILLFVILMLRLFFYSKPADILKNFSSKVLITNPTYIEDGVMVINSNPHAVKTRQWGDYKMGYYYTVLGDKYYNTIYAKKITLVEKSYLEPLFYLKNVLIINIQSVLLEPFSSLVLGMLFGVPPNYSDAYKNILIKAGIIHVIVVSGYNISILFSFISSAFYFISIKKRMIIASFVSITFALFTGFEPPILRALVFGLIVAFAKATGYKFSVVYIMVLTGLLMGIFSPSIIYTVSFQLSFMACLGLVLFSRGVSVLINKIWILSILPEQLKESFTASFCAQLLVFPILLFYFNGISLISLITNVLVLWLIPTIMLMGLFLSILSLFGLLYFIKILLFVIYLPLIFFIDITELMSKIPITVNIVLSEYQVFLIYLNIFLIMFFYNRAIKDKLTKYEKKAF